MPRLREVPRAEAHEGAVRMYDYVFGEGRDPVAQPGTPVGTPGNWWTVVALVPDVFDHAVAGLALYRSRRRLLDPQLRELGMTRTGWLRESRFVFSQHCKSCREVGIPEEKIRAIPAWPVFTDWTPAERAVLAWTDEVVGADGRTTDATFTELRAHLSDEQILELTYIIGLYEMHAIMSRALRLEFDDADDRITEVPGPEGMSPAAPAGARPAG